MAFSSTAEWETNPSDSLSRRRLLISQNTNASNLRIASTSCSAYYHLLDENSRGKSLHSPGDKRMPKPTDLGLHLLHNTSQLRPQVAPRVFLKESSIDKTVRRYEAKVTSLKLLHSWMSEIIYLKHCSRSACRGSGREGPSGPKRSPKAWIPSLPNLISNQMSLL